MTQSAKTKAKGSAPRRRAEALRDCEVRVLEMVATGIPLHKTLAELARLFEAHAEGMLASILLIEDGTRVRHAAAPSLSKRWIRQVDGEPIGPDRGSCGTAAYLKQPVIVTDIGHDPRWVKYRDTALRAGLRACWSVPILGPGNQVLGTFALYYTEPRKPTKPLLHLATEASHLAAVAIQRHRHEEAIRENQHHLSLLYDHVDDVLFQLRVDPEGYRFLAVNPAFLTATGLKPPDVIGKLVQEVIPEPSRSLVLAKYAEAIRTNHTVRWEETTRYPSGIRQGDVAITPVTDGEGRLKYLIGSVRDMTEQRRMLEELRQLQKREAIGRLSGGIAHDFNNILSVILGVGNLLLQEIQDPDQRSQLEEMIESGERGANLTRQFLAFGRQQVLEPLVLDLRTLIRRLEPMLRRLLRKEITLRTSLDPALWRVRADPTQIEQVVVNLVVNARDAMSESGTVSIETANCDVDETTPEPAGISPGKYLRLTVSDTGCGMDEETCAKVFEPFFTTKEVGRGTGLGLATVFGIVSQSGGRIRVNSRPGRGSTFSVYLPATMEAASVPRQRGETRAAPAPGLRGTRVLLVEDDPSLRRALERMLTRLECRVTAAASGDEALRQVETGGLVPDLLLTDTAMPGLNGVALIRRLRAARPGLKVIRMSGYTDPDPAPGTTDEIHTVFLRKPITIADLIESIRRAMERE
jgi:PAS domain S-box-containing protein